MQDFKVIAFTYKCLPLDLIGKLHLSPEKQAEVLNSLKINFHFRELLFLSTCNRVELFVKTNKKLTSDLIEDLVFFLNQELSEEETSSLVSGVVIFNSHEAVEHVLKLASSLESLVVGEREIITQVRKAYDFCNQLGLTGDFLRLLNRHTIETAKEIYTSTDIAKNPVSVTSLAYRQLRALGINHDARIIFVGSGETNTTMARYFQKHQFANFTVFNRTHNNARKLGQLLKADSFDLSALTYYKKGFDVLVVCTASKEPIVTEAVFKTLLNNETSNKVIIDLSLPQNTEQSVALNKQVYYIDINSLKTKAEINLELRKGEIMKCEQIIKTKAKIFESLYLERAVELAFGQIPKQVKAIKEQAINQVFAKELSSLDPQGKEVVEKVLSYVEKKYNAVTIKAAKEIFADKN